MIYTLTLNPAIDRTLTVPDLAFNKVLRSFKVTIDCGGKGFNVSRALYLLGGDSTIIGLIGGNSGKIIEKGLSSLNLRTDFIHIKGDTRTNLVCMDPKREKHIKVNEPGPEISISEQIQLFEKVKTLTKPGDTWVLSGSLPPGIPVNFYSRLIEMVQILGAKAWLDTSGEALKNGIKARPFLVKPNREEVEESLNLDIRKINDSIEAGNRFHSLGIQWVAMSLGRKGLVLSNNGNAVHAPAPRIKVANSVGAGDALLAGLLWASSQNLGLKETAAWGVAAGSAAAQLEGVNFATYSEVYGLWKNIIGKVRNL